MTHLTQMYEIKKIPVDLVVAYASLAPLVSQAFAYLDCDKKDAAMECLTRALQVIEATNNFPLCTIQPQATVVHKTASPFDLPDLEKAVAKTQDHNLF